MNRLGENNTAILVSTLVLPLKTSFIRVSWATKTEKKKNASGFPWTPHKLAISFGKTSYSTPKKSQKLRLSFPIFFQVCKLFKSKTLLIIFFIFSIIISLYEIFVPQKNGNFSLKSA